MRRRHRILTLGTRLGAEWPGGCRQSETGAYTPSRLLAASFRRIERRICAAEALQNLSGASCGPNGRVEELGIAPALLAQVADEPRHLDEQLPEPCPICRGDARRSEDRPQSLHAKLGFELGLDGLPSPFQQGDACAGLFNSAVDDDHLPKVARHHYPSLLKLRLMEPLEHGHERFKNRFKLREARVGGAGLRRSHRTRLGASAPEAAATRSRCRLQSAS